MVLVDWIWLAIHLLRPLSRIFKGVLVEKGEQPAFVLSSELRSTLHCHEHRECLLPISASPSTELPPNSSPTVPSATSSRNSFMIASAAGG